MLSLILAFTISLPALQAMADTKIGYVKLDKILQSPQSLESGKRLQKEFSSRAADLDKMKKQIDDKQAAYDKDLATMAESTRKSRTDDLNNLKIDFERKQRELAEDLDMRKNEERASLQDRVNKAVTSIAQSEGYDLILYSNAAYASKNADITDKVLKVLK